MSHFLICDSGYLNLATSLTHYFPKYEGLFEALSKFAEHINDDQRYLYTWLHNDMHHMYREITCPIDRTLEDDRVQNLEKKWKLLIPHDSLWNKRCTTWHRIFHSMTMVLRDSLFLDIFAALLFSRSNDHKDQSEHLLGPCFLLSEWSRCCGALRMGFLTSSRTWSTLVWSWVGWSAPDKSVYSNRIEDYCKAMKYFIQVFQHNARLYHAWQEKSFKRRI